MSSVDFSDVTDAVVLAVEATFGDRVTVGDGEAPDLSLINKASLAVSPFVVVTMVPTGDRYIGGPFGRGDGMEWIRYQFSVTGAQRRQVERVANSIADGMADPAVSPMTVSGHAVIYRRRIGAIPLDPVGEVSQAGALVEFLVQVAV